MLLVISIRYLTGGTTGPVLYPNEHLQNVGELQAHKAILYCLTYSWVYQIIAALQGQDREGKVTVNGLATYVEEVSAAEAHL